jgi:hypothetical protein
MPEDNLQVDTPPVDGATPPADVTPPVVVDAPPPVDTPPVDAPKDDADPKGDEAPKDKLPKADDPINADNWLDKVSRGDEKRLKRLSRYASPEALADALIAAQDKITGSGLKTPAPTDDSEALTRWRADNGIPDTVDGYDIELDDGLVIGEADQPLVDNFLDLAHTNNIDPALANKIINFQLESQAEFMRDFAVQEADRSKVARQDLINEWGENYTVEINGIENSLEAQGMSDMLMARMPDGSLVKDNPEMMVKLSEQSRTLNPGFTTVPGAGNAGKAIKSEMAEIEAKQGTTAYTAADRARYEVLITANEKLEGRG